MYLHGDRASRAEYNKSSSFWGQDDPEDRYDDKGIYPRKKNALPEEYVAVAMIIFEPQFFSNFSALLRLRSSKSVISKRFWRSESFIVKNRLTNSQGIRKSGIASRVLIKERQRFVWEFVNELCQIMSYVARLATNQRSFFDWLYGSCCAPAGYS